MTERASPSIREQLERAGRDPPAERYVLRLYIAGLTARSTRAVAKVRELLELRPRVVDGPDRALDLDCLLDAFHDVTPPCGVAAGALTCGDVQ